MEKIQKHIIQCSDYCGIVEVLEFEDSDGVFMSYYAPVFSARQESFFSRVVERIKWAWFILCGKEFALYEIHLSKDDLKEFRTMIDKMIE
jgi:hypothetical protein